MCCELTCAPEKVAQVLILVSVNVTFFFFQNRVFAGIIKLRQSHPVLR